ncbi:hypothetical protein ASPSYDRAFT_713348 [Aspergillus sydowii CBS 593.65]|uniref:Uncharacterized protein n=1 Tax=Aspergillus sydowii CBS 593.65 TaxID=1036612 RepID=A0A1L9SYU8_9EURO|nr:uncharacterized protein ASPSYDRAFT_713348 [Aspergillus sydowii CBS 593.65]OJJ52326.1 hypothetical protein ASPSYDRAFT_713348 [Aspergillus sydowii CBS 593.65]
MTKVPSRTSMSSGSSGPRPSNNRVRIQEPAAVATQLTRPRRRQSMTQTPPQPISHSQAANDSTEALENHSVCLKTVKDLECDLHKVETERDRLLRENETLRQQLSQAQDAQSVGHTWEDIQRAVHGAQEALNTCHQQLITCMTNAANTGVPSATLPGSTAGPDSMWANQDEGLGVLNPQMFFDV